MLPGKDGLAVLKDMRSLEASRDMSGSKGVKVIMTTALGDADRIMSAFG